MEEDKSSEVESNLRNLIAASCPALAHPFLLAIAMAAPSPTAADRHIKKVLAGNKGVHEIARAVRNAVKLREKVSEEEWQKLTDRDENFRLSNLFLFENIPTPIEFSSRFLLTEGGGHSIDQDDWPALIRETEFLDVSSTGGDSPDYSLELFNGHNGSWEYHLFNFLPSESANKMTMDNADTTRLGRKFRASTLHLDKGVFCQTRLALVRDLSEDFPRLYKAVRIARRLRLDCPNEAQEEIRIATKIDYGSGEPDRGIVEYRRTLLAHENANVTLRLRWEITGGFWLKIKSSISDVISLSSTSPMEHCHEKLPNGRFDKDGIGKVAGRLTEDLNKLLPVAVKKTSGSERLSLYKLAGKTLIDNPPDELMELFFRPAVDEQPHKTALR